MSKRRIDLSNGNEVTRTDVHEANEACLMGADPGFIEKQEARGQQELAKSEQLPTEGMAEVHQFLEAAGGRVLGKTRGDPIFMDVRLPVGWRVRPTDHSMWSDLLDEQGRKRAAIFYKAAFYDRSAHMSACRRLIAMAECVDHDERPRAYYGVIKDGDTVVWRGERRTEWTDDELKKRYEQARRSGGEFPKDADEVCRAEADALLRSLFPDTDKTTAYWELSAHDIAARMPASAWQPSGEEYTFHVELFSRERVEDRPYFGDAGFEPYECAANGVIYRGDRRKREGRTELRRQNAFDWKSRRFDSVEDAERHAHSAARRRFSEAAQIIVTIRLGGKQVSKITVQ